MAEPTAKEDLHGDALAVAPASTACGSGGEGGNRLAEPLDRLIDRLASDWRPLVERWRHGDAGRALIDFVDARVAAGAVVYPADVFAALRRTPLSETRLVILGQDPYHGAGQAEGLAFSVPPGIPLPPSLRNILKEVERSGCDLLPTPAGGHLGGWAGAGVLLLNTSLTVEHGEPASHARRGWEALTDDIVVAAARDPQPKVFMLWGAHAQSKARLIADVSSPHCVLQSNHPSPLSAARGASPFVGCDHFRLAQAFLARAREGAGGFPKANPAVADGPLAPAADPGIIAGSPRRGARVAKGGRL